MQADGCEMREMMRRREEWFEMSGGEDVAKNLRGLGLIWMVRAVTETVDRFLCGGQLQACM